MPEVHSTDNGQTSIRPASANGRERTPQKLGKKDTRRKREKEEWRFGLFDCLDDAGLCKYQFYSVPSRVVNGDFYLSRGKNRSNLSRARPGIVFCAKSVFEDVMNVKRHVLFCKVSGACSVCRAYSRTTFRCRTQRTGGTFRAACTACAFTALVVSETGPLAFEYARSSPK